jgi:peptidoglycan hydrolase-like protein with peptidoglycan-binding domain
MSNISRKAVLGVAAALAAATTVTVTAGAAGASTVTKTAPASRAVVAALAAPATSAAPMVSAQPAVSAAPAVVTAPTGSARRAAMAAPALPTMLSWPLTQFGATGERVIDIQSFLNVKIGAGLVVDGVFGSATRAAVIKFQQVYGLSADGKVGQQTWPALLVQPLQQGSNGQAVWALQHNLRFGFNYSIATDGVFGPITRSAVINFQVRFGIGVDGVVGPVTWNTIINNL